MGGSERAVYLSVALANAGILLAGAVVALLVVLSARTRHCRPAAWLLFAATTGVFVMNAIQLLFALASAALVGALGFNGYLFLVRAMLVVEWPIALLLGVALLGFRAEQGT
jgi:hypothetical protein